MEKKYKTGFEINKLISLSGIFTKLKMPPSACLVLRAIADYWNYNKGEAFPTQKTLAYNTGLDVRTIRDAVNILKEKKLINVKLYRKRHYYTFSGLFIRLIACKEENISSDRGKITRNIAEKSPANKIIKNKENTSLILLNDKNCEDDEDTSPISEEERLKIVLSKLDEKVMAPLVRNLKRKLEALQASTSSGEP